jgi:hypothetical protein
VLPRSLSGLTFDYLPEEVFVVDDNCVCKVSIERFQGSLR